MGGPECPSLTSNPCSPNQPPLPSLALAHPELHPSLTLPLSQHSNGQLQLLASPPWPMLATPSAMVLPPGLPALVLMPLPFSVLAGGTQTVSSTTLTAQPLTIRTSPSLLSTIFEMAHSSPPLPCGAMWVLPKPLQLAPSLSRLLSAVQVAQPLAGRLGAFEPVSHLTDLQSNRTFILSSALTN
ncbi:hypothetical protein NDA10_003277 [Ustilago hordei]|nr:hypothetical protein NDA10_003277 [Ustilago hordei]UTT91101.1 hypothetical protein NDA17_000508 [Ustilago hordei]